MACFGLNGVNLGKGAKDRTWSQFIMDLFTENERKIGGKCHANDLFQCSLKVWIKRNISVRFIINAFYSNNSVTLNKTKFTLKKHIMSFFMKIISVQLSYYVKTENKIRWAAKGNVLMIRFYSGASLRRFQRADFDICCRTDCTELWFGGPVWPTGYTSVPSRLYMRLLTLKWLDRLCTDV